MIKRLIHLSVYFASLAFMLWIIGFMGFCVYALSLKYSPQNHSDAIVVLTGGSRRIKTGIDLVEKKKADFLLISGVNRKVKPQKLLADLSEETKAKITLGYTAENTRGNAQEINDWIQGKNIHSIILVTSFYHMPRSVFEMLQANSRLKIIPWPVFPQSFNQSVDWVKTRYAWLLFIEYHKFLYIHVKYFLS